MAIADKERSTARNMTERQIRTVEKKEEKEKKEKKRRGARNKWRMTKYKIMQMEQRE